MREEVERSPGLPIHLQTSTVVCLQGWFHSQAGLIFVGKAHQHITGSSCFVRLLVTKGFALAELAGLFSDKAQSWSMPLQPNHG